MAENVKTPKFRVSFPAVYRPRLNELSGNQEFSVVMLFPKGADLTDLKKDAERAAKEKWGDKIPANLRSPFRDQGDKEYEGYEAGAIFITAKSTQKPAVVGTEVVDGKFLPIEESEFYPGCYARASVQAYAYDQKGNKGVSFGLRNIQKLDKGDPLGNRTRAEDDFDMPAADASAPDEGAPADSIFT